MTSTEPTQSALRQALDHIFEGETERRIAIALCELDGYDPDGLTKSENEPSFRRGWEYYLPQAREAISGK